jgi:hypothetical protein
MGNFTRWTTTLLAAGLLSLGASVARTQQTVEGPRFKVNAAEIQIGGRVQMQFNTTSVEDEPTTQWLMRRVRLEANVKVNEVVSGKVQPDFAGNRVVLKDAYLKLNFAPALQLLAGNAHRPFSLLEQTSSTRILPIERGVEIRGLDAADEYELVHGLRYSDRDIGLQVMGAPRGAPLGFAYAAGVFQGPLAGRVGALDTYQLAARATIEPLERVRLGFGWSGRDFAEPGPSAATPALRLVRGNAFEADLEIGSFAPGFHLLGEVAFGDADPLSGAEFMGAQSWLAYRTRPLGPTVSAVEPIFRASWSEVDRGTPSAGEVVEGTLLTPGINLYFGPLNRVMLNYDFWFPGGDADAEGSFKAMFQLAF